MPAGSKVNFTAVINYETYVATYNATALDKAGLSHNITGTYSGLRAVNWTVVQSNKTL